MSNHRNKTQEVFRFHGSPFSVSVELIGSLGIDSWGVVPLFHASESVQREGSGRSQIPSHPGRGVLWTDEALAKSDETRLGELVGGA